MRECGLGLQEPKERSQLPNTGWIENFWHFVTSLQGSDDVVLDIGLPQYPLDEAFVSF